MAVPFAIGVFGFMERSARSELRPGLMVAVALGAIATFMSRGLGGPLARSPLLIAILIGCLIGNSFGCPESLRPGLTFTIRRLLRLAVALIGFRIMAHQVVDLGVGPFLIAACILTVTFVFTVWAARRFFGVEREMAYLLAAGSAVCGAAAVLAVAEVVRARPQQTTLAVTLITVLGTLTLLTYPVAFATGYLPRLGENTYGVFIGATVYEVAQVVGASYAVSELAGNTAIVVKLSKVLMLIPLLIILSLWMRRSHPDQRAAHPIVPWFVVAFALIVGLNTLRLVPEQMVAAINEGSLFLLTVVMVALGLETRVGRFQELRWATRATYAALLTLVIGASLGYGLVRSVSPALAALEGGDAARPLYRGVLSSGSKTAEGERLFMVIGCAKCHTPSLSVGNRQVFVYSDLLLHTMGPALDDKVVQGEAGGSDWRTTPLWGLGLRTRFLHDGRATTLRDAIVVHGGEAQIVTRRFLDLTPSEKEALYHFLRSL
jgi:uncharacterized integral membrane protein (TIGR00698 family)